MDKFLEIYNSLFHINSELRMTFKTINISLTIGEDFINFLEFAKNRNRFFIIQTFNHHCNFHFDIEKLIIFHIHNKQLLSIIHYIKSFNNFLFIYLRKILKS